MDKTYTCLEVSDEIIKRAKTDYLKLKKRIESEKDKYKDSNLSLAEIEDKIYYTVEIEYKEFWTNYHITQYKDLAGCHARYLIRIWSAMIPLFKDITIYPMPYLP